MDSLPLAMQVFGAVGGVGSGIASSVSNASAYKADANAQRYQTSMAVQAERKKNAQSVAKMNAIGAASGLDISSGTPLEMAIDSAFQGEMNALNLEYQGRSREASLRSAGQSAKSGIFDSIMGGIGASGSLLGKWMIDDKLKKAKPYGGGGPRASSFESWWGG